MLSAVRGDITHQRVDAVVNAAAPELLGGGGVDGAIHRAGGPAILAECRLRKADLPGGLLPRGQAVSTTAGRLPARWVIHTAGPVYAADEDRSAVLAASYRNSLALAASLGARTVAFPAVSAGLYGWPLDSAAGVAVHAVRSIMDSSPGGVERVYFVLLSQAAYDAFVRALATAS